MAQLLDGMRRHRLELFSAAALIVLIWILWTARGALPAFVIGLALAFVLDPGVTLLQRRGVPRWAGVLVMYVAVVAFFWIVIAFAVPPVAAQLQDFLRRLPELGDNASALQSALNRWYEDLAIPDGVRAAIDDALITVRDTTGEIVSGIAAPFATAIFRTAAFVAGLFIIPVWLFFVLKDRERLPDLISTLLPPSWRADGRNVLQLLSRVGGRWVRGQLLLGASVFIATVIGITALTVLGFGELGRFTFILALVAGVLEWFPIIGPIVAAVPAILIAFTISPAAVVAVIILYVVIQQLENNLLVPKVMGDAIELHPAVMVLALVVGGALFGVWGAILAAPIVASARDLYRYGYLRLAGDAPEPAYAIVANGATAGATEASVVLSVPENEAADRSGEPARTEPDTSASAPTARSRARTSARRATTRRT